MKLVLKNNNGESVTLVIQPDETFSQLRKRVEDEVGILIDMKDIAIKGKKIDDDQKVLQYFGSCGLESPRDEPDQVCVVPGCHNTKSKTPGKTFFQFPAEEIRCHQWALYCQRLNMMSGKHRLELNSQSTVCSDHFRSDQFVKNTTTLLKRTAVPCINPDLPVCDASLSNKRSNSLLTSNKTRRRKSDSQFPRFIENGHSCNMKFNHRPIKEETSDLICRLCADPSTDFIFIFDEVGTEMQIAKKINTCLPISVKITDPFPKQICRSCYEELDRSYALATTCIEAENKLKELSKEILLRLRNQFSGNSQNTSSSHENDKIKIEEETQEAASPCCPLCVEGKMGKKHDSENGFVPNGVIEDLAVDELPPLDIISDKVKEEREELREETFDDSPQPGKSTDSDVETFNGVIGFSTNLSVEDEWEKRNSKTGGDTFLFSCRLCSADFRDSTSILQHSLLHSDEGFYQCCICDSYFSFQEGLESHFLIHTSNNSNCNGSIHKYECCEIKLNSGMPCSNHNCSKSKSIVQAKRCKFCRKVFRSQSRLQFHMKFHKGAKQGYCELCQKTFPDEVKLYKHTMYLHSTDKAHCCEECGKIFRSVSSLRYHQRSHQGEEIMKPFSCDRCGKCFIRKSMLRNHIATSHKYYSQEGSCYICKKCNEAFPRTDSAVAHMENQHSLECDKDQSYSFEMLTVTRLYMCEYCERCFSNNLHLNRHREQHKDETPYQCRICNEVFISFADHCDHKILHHRELSSVEFSSDYSVPTAYLCEYCDRTFTSQVKFSEHLTVHYGPAPYHCRYCARKFATSEEVVQHRSTHGDVSVHEEFNFYRPYECHYCNKSFAIEDALVKHIRMHTGEKPFICDQCGKGFSQSSGLYTHQKVHSNERPYTCPLCPRTFKIKGDRDVHVRKHSGDRPYKCEFCGKAFMTQHVYSQHRKIHTGERPYKCDVCGIAFRRSHVLTVHKRIHTGEKPNVCDICGKRYRQKGDMLKHRRIQHGLVKVKLQKVEF